MTHLAVNWDYMQNLQRIEKRVERCDGLLMSSRILAMLADYVARSIAEVLAREQLQ
jgi:hypothetical protein